MTTVDEFLQKNNLWQINPVGEKPLRNGMDTEHKLNWAKVTDQKWCTLFILWVFKKYPTEKAAYVTKKGAHELYKMALSGEWDEIWKDWKREFDFACKKDHSILEQSIITTNNPSFQQPAAGKKQLPTISGDETDPLNHRFFWVEGGFSLPNSMMIFRGRPLYTPEDGVVFNILLPAAEAADSLRGEGLGENINVPGEAYKVVRKDGVAIAYLATNTTRGNTTNITPPTESDLSLLNKAIKTGNWETALKMLQNYPQNGRHRADVAAYCSTFSNAKNAFNGQRISYDDFSKAGVRFFNALTALRDDLESQR